LKDQAISTFLGQNPPFELPPEWDFAVGKSLSRPITGHQQQGHQATNKTNKRQSGFSALRFGFAFAPVSPALVVDAPPGYALPRLRPVSSRRKRLIDALKS
jgi:hypothetical protein